MPAGPIGACWAAGSWADTAWEVGSWADGVIVATTVLGHRDGSQLLHAAAFRRGSPTTRAGVTGGFLVGPGGSLVGGVDPVGPGPTPGPTPLGHRSGTTGGTRTRRSG